MNHIRKIVILLAVSIASATSGQELKLSIKDCRDMSLAHNEEIKKAEISYRQSDLDIEIANTGRLPKLEGSATGVVIAPDIDMLGMKLQNRGTYMAGLQITQPIYAGGKITAGRKLAGIGKKVAQEQLRMRRMDVVADADNSYWSYVAVIDKVALLDSYILMLDTLYSQTAAAVEAGMALENDLLRVSAKRSELRYQKQKAQNGADLCRMALCNMMGLDYSTSIIPIDSVPVCEEPGVLQADITVRPEYNLLLHQVDAAREQVNLTRGDFLPTVGLSLGYTYYGNIKVKGMADAGDGSYIPYTRTFRDGMFAGMLGVSIPLFHWGEDIKKVRKARLDVESATLGLTHASGLLDLEARQAAINLSDGWTMIGTAREALEQAAENLRVMSDRYDESMAPLSDLLDAQTQWHQARSNLIEATTQYQVYRTAWLRASGKLDY